MNWLRIYDELIAHRRMNPPADGEYVEKHHVVPRCMGGSNAPSNLIPLRPEDHFFGHVLLAKHYGTSNLWAAVTIMAGAVGGANSHYTRVRTMYGMSRRMSYYATSGARSHQYDHTVYDFISQGGLRERCTPYTLWKKYKLDRSELSKLVKGRRKSTGGWALLSRTQEARFYWGQSAKGENNCRVDRTVRKWCHKDSTMFEGTTQALALECNRSANHLSAVARGDVATIFGWYLTSKYDAFPSAIFLSNSSRKQISIKHMDGRKLSGPRPFVTKEAGIKGPDIYRLLTGDSHKVKGWMMDDGIIRCKPPKKKRDPSKNLLAAHLVHPELGEFIGDSTAFAEKYCGKDRKAAVKGFRTLIHEERNMWHKWRMVHKS